MSVLKSNMKWFCPCGAKLNVTGQPELIAGMLQNFVNLHPCALREPEDSHDGDNEGREPEKQGASAQVEHAGERVYDDLTLGKEHPVIIGFTPNKGEWPPPVKVDENNFEE